MTPGPFAVSINQPPLPAANWSKVVGWPIARIRVAQSRDVSPTHLLRQVFGRCATYAEACRMVRETRLCIPAIFTVAGPEDDEAVVTERTRDAAFIPPKSVAANNWSSPMAPAGRPRNASSLARHAAMCSVTTAEIEQASLWSLAWVRPPLIQPDTRLVLVASLRSGTLVVQGWEKTSPATKVLKLDRAPS